MTKSVSTMHEDCDWGSLSQFCENRRRTTCQSLSDKESKMDEMEADNRRAMISFHEGIVVKKGETRKKIVKKNIENAANKIQHRTNAQKEKGMMRTPKNVWPREEAAARCTAKIRRRVLRRQARKARVEHLIRCNFGAGEKKAKRKPLT